jgi:4-hydroxy-tetrahydrodipicolinate reductase
MNIALIGYGKMGHTIERIAAGRGHNIVLKITSKNREEFTRANLANVDVAIEFTSPESGPENVAISLNAGIPTISGSTGWNDKLDIARQQALSNNTAFLHASNFSIGVNIFFEINKLLARLMSTQDSYKASIEEVHHLQKKDKPSGTAITLAEQIIALSMHQKSWALKEDASTSSSLPIAAIREEGVPGTHTISWTSEVDTIDIRHTAHNREGFALGAVLAAEFIQGKSGVFSMGDVLAINGL